MTLKFKRTFADKLKDVKNGAVESTRDINDNTKMAYDVKRKDIEDTMIPKSAMAILTPEEVRRAERVGLSIGFAVILIIVLGFFLLTLRNMGWI